MTYNILMGGQSGAALHQVIREANPDVLLVNETPKTPVLWKRQCRKLAEKWGMRWIVGGREAGSNMIAISERIGVKSFDAYTLWTPPFRPRRGIATAQLRIEGRLFAAVSCHLSLERERRVDDVERVIEAANRLRGPVVLGGDLNQPPGQWSWRRLRQVGFVDCGSDEWLTFPAAAPGEADRCSARAWQCEGHPAWRSRRATDVAERGERPPPRLGRPRSVTI